MPEKVEMIGNSQPKTKFSLKLKNVVNYITITYALLLKVTV